MAKEVVINGVIWDKDRVLINIRTNTPFLIKALHYLYQRQERDEKEDETVYKRNGVGFNRSDTPYLTHLGKLLSSGRYDMTAFDIQECKRRLPKYANQIIDIIIERNATGKDGSQPKTGSS